MGAIQNVVQKPAPELSGTMAQDLSGDKKEKTLDVKVTSIKTEGASQDTCHNPCNVM